MRLAAEGALVAALDVDKEAASATARQIAAAGGTAMALTADVSVESEVSTAIEAAAQAWDGLDIVIANAGIELDGLDARADQLELSVWQRTIDVNLMGTLYGIGAVLPHMKAQKSGHIINVSSIAGHKVRPGSAVYAAAKTGVRVISEGLRLEVKPYNIRTTASHRARSPPTSPTVSPSRMSPRVSARPWRSRSRLTPLPGWWCSR